MVSRRGLAFGIVTAALLSIGLAEAVQLPGVQIDFKITEPDYRDEFFDSQLADLRLAGATLLAELLADEVGFLAFSPASEEAVTSTLPGPQDSDCPESGTDYRLCIRLDGLERGSQGVAHEVGLHFQLRGPEVRENEARDYWMFRSRQEWELPVPGVPELLTEIRLKLADADYPGLVREVLSQIKLSERCQVRKEMPAGWILPFTHEDLCMDRGTKLTIEHEVIVAMIALELSFTVEASGELLAPGSPEHGQVFCKPAAGLDPLQLAELHEAPAEAVAKTKIFVVDYQRLDTECSREPQSPAELDFEEGGS